MIDTINRILQTTVVLRCSLTKVHKCTVIFIDIHKVVLCALGS